MWQNRLSDKSDAQIDSFSSRANPETGNAAARGSRMNPNEPVRRTMSLVEWGLLIGLSVLWGASFFFNGVAVKELPTFVVVVDRVALAALLLIIVTQIAGIKVPTERPVVIAFFTMAFINNVVPFTLIVWGQSHISSALASILNATTPLFAVIVAHYFTGDEKMSWGRFFGVFIGLAGVTVMVGSDALRSFGVNIAAQLAVLGAAFCYAISGVFARRFRRMGISPIATATGQLTAASIMLVPIMLVVDKPWTLPMPSLQAIGALIGVAVLSTALAYIVYFRILGSAGATNVLLVTFLIPVTAIFLGIFILDEVLLPKHFLGMALIGVGLAAIDGRVFRRLFRKPAEAKPAATRSLEHEAAE